MKHIASRHIPQNIGMVDRLVRFGLTSALIGSMFYAAFTGATAGAIAWLPLVGLYPGLTGYIGWDPVYEALGIRSCGVTRRDRCGDITSQAKAVMGQS